MKNGMTVLFEKRNSPAVSVAFAVRCGGINESSQEKGISHFIEHLLYKGTPTRNSKKIAEEIERKGGDLNGFTDEMITAYYCKMPKKHLQTALEILGDMVKNPIFDSKEILKEREVIFEEMKMYQDNPLKCVFSEISSCLYETPFGISLIGSQKTLNSINRKKIVEKFKRVYSPNNLILCVVGNAEFKQILEFAEKNFGNSKGKISQFKIKKRNLSEIRKRSGIDQANLVFAYHVPTLREKGSGAALILSVLMAGGMSSRLFQEIREKRNLAYAVKGQSEINRDFAHNLIYVGTKKENVGLCKNLILEEFKKVSENLTESELLQVKEQIIGNHYIFSEDSHNQMAHLLYYELNGGAEKLYDFEKKIREIRLKDVKKLAEIPLKKFSFFALVPK